MKKYFLASFLIIIIISVVVLVIINPFDKKEETGDKSEEKNINIKESELYRGFPVFPPENIEEIEGKDNFSLEVRGREDVLEKMKEINKRMFPTIIDSPTENWHEKIIEARNYVTQAAEETDWILTDSDMFLDGGSMFYKFMYPKEEKIEVVVFISWSPMIMIESDNISVDKDWGILNYSFEELPALPKYKGFPLIPGTESIEEYEIRDFSKGVEIIHKEQHGAEVFREIVNLAQSCGWKLHYSPYYQTGEALFKKENQLVKVKIDEPLRQLEISFIFYNKDYYEDVLTIYPETIEEEKETPYGLFIHDGRYIRRPYTVRVNMEGIFVNDTQVKRINLSDDRNRIIHGMGSGYKTEFDRWVDRFNKKSIYITTDLMRETGSATRSSHYQDEEEAEEFLMTIDGIVRNDNLSREEKLNRLEEELDLRSWKEAILENWNGIE